MSEAISHLKELIACKQLVLFAIGGKEYPTMPLGDALWGAYAGFLTDKFGVRRMINYTYPKP